MTQEKKSILAIEVEKLDDELIAREYQTTGEKIFDFGGKDGPLVRDVIIAQTRNLYHNYASVPFNPAFSHISTGNLVKMLMVKIRELNAERGIWGEDDRKDYYKIENPQVRQNANCVAAICTRDCLTSDKSGSSELKSMKYGTAFNLCDSEPFHHQSIAAGRLYTAFLVKENVIATAGHCIDAIPFTDIRFIFDFKMSGSSTPVTRIPSERIYKGIYVIKRVCNPNSGADWALVKLDRKITDQSIAVLSEQNITPGQPVYIIGHPLGLPLKYSGGAQVRNVTEACFSADLTIYSGNSGSPVFCCDTHEVVGIVVRGDNQDFRWTGNGWLSIIYPNRKFKSQEPQCTKVSEFIKYC